MRGRSSPSRSQSSGSRKDHGSRVRVLLAASLALWIPLLANATAVIDANVLLALGSPPGVNDVLTVFQDEAATDPTSVVFDYDGSHLEIVSWNVDEESEWYLVEADDVQAIQRFLDPGMKLATSTVEPVGEAPLER